MKDVGTSAVCDQAHAPVAGEADGGVAPPVGNAQDEVAEREPWEGPELLHTAETGTLLLGTRKGDGTYDALRAAGQRRWRSLRDGEYVGALYVPGTRDRPANRTLIRTAERVLSDAGFAVRVTIDDRPRDAGVVAEARRERLEGRGERLGERAERWGGVADAAFGRAHEIADGIPMGQPILVGHHSERRARRDRERIDAGMRAGSAAAETAERLAAAAAAPARTLERAERPLQTARRIHKAEADLRGLARALDDYERRFPKPSGEVYDVEVQGPASGEHREALLAEVAHLESKLAADRVALAAHVDAGRWKIVDGRQVKPGDRVRVPDGWAVVVKGGRATVTVANAHVGTLRYGIHEVGDHREAVTPS
ncbi:MAG TPA: DUF3560 domain-containing protein [Conexibacter sp.]|nr:DUF3560 domain-containing protein [Conexibacter sp.]